MCLRSSYYFVEGWGVSYLSVAATKHCVQGSNRKALFWLPIPDVWIHNGDDSMAARRINDHILSCKQEMERVNRKCGEAVNSQPSSRTTNWKRSIKILSLSGHFFSKPDNGSLEDLALVLCIYLYQLKISPYKKWNLTEHQAAVTPSSIENILMLLIFRNLTLYL